MLQLLILLAALGLSVGDGDDPWEVRPLRERVVVLAPWGEGQGNLSPPRSFDPQEIEIGPGPFCVDQDGGLYIHDPRRGRVERFDSQGIARESIPCRPRLGMVARIAADGRSLFVLEESLFGYGAWAIDLASGATVPLELSGPAELRRDATGRPVHDACELIADGRSVELYHRPSGLRFPLLEAGVPVAPASQESTERLGWPVGDGRGVHRAGPSGEVVLAARLRESGRIVLRDAGFLWGADATAILTEEAREIAGGERYYLRVHRLDGRLLSRTRIARRPMRARFQCGPRFVWAAGAVHELHFSEEGVVLSRWEPVR